jgi:uncharacterized protein (TIGR02145 family)
MKYITLIIPISILYFVIGCDSADPVSPERTFGMVKDIDGNKYVTVKIGDQWWMAQNLRTSRYRNGEVIPTNHTNYQWANTASDAYAIYPDTLVGGINSDAEMVNVYGNLYNWLTVDDPRGLCPVGWHVPSDAEWKQLEMHLGMTQQEADETLWRGTDEGGKLKSTRTEPEAHPRWSSPNTRASNESGFSGVPGGYRSYFGFFDHFKYYGFWWSSSEFSTNRTWYRYLSYINSNVGRDNSNKRNGFSVRCIKDD